jgi:cytochrome oxidase assembly protein ShyY1
VEPLTEIELPELSNGPHYAYGVQWLAFALLAIIGRFLLFRESKRLSLVKVEI